MSNITMDKNIISEAAANFPWQEKIPCSNPLLRTPFNQASRTGRWHDRPGRPEGLRSVYQACKVKEAIALAESLDDDRKLVNQNIEQTIYTCSGWLNDIARPSSMQT